MAHTETMLESKEIFNGRVIRVTVDKVQHDLDAGDRPPPRRRLHPACGRRRQRDDGTSVPLRFRRGDLGAARR